MRWGENEGEGTRGESEWERVRGEEMRRGEHA